MSLHSFDYMLLFLVPAVKQHSPTEQDRDTNERLNAFSLYKIASANGVISLSVEMALNHTA